MFHVEHRARSGRGAGVVLVCQMSMIAPGAGSLTRWPVLSANAARHRKAKIHRKGADERRRYTEMRSGVVSPMTAGFHPPDSAPEGEETVTILPLPLGSPPRLIGEP
jgi:hypothetical protein